MKHLPGRDVDGLTRSPPLTNRRLFQCISQKLNASGVLRRMAESYLYSLYLSTRLRSTDFLNRQPPRVKCDNASLPVGRLLSEELSYKNTKNVNISSRPVKAKLALKRSFAEKNTTQKPFGNKPSLPSNSTPTVQPGRTIAAANHI
jgi:hypothetical protein